MDKHRFSYNIKKFLRFNACGFPTCARLELEAIKGKLDRLNA
ncbi:MAG: hypothetical protein V3T32_00485 [Thermodesulfobacteriota bacterium]